MLALSGFYYHDVYGVYVFSVYGLKKPKLGVNMDEMEWAMLVENFTKVKEVLKGKSVDLSACMRSADYEEYIKMYAALWFVDDKPPNNTTPILFYSEEEAKSAAYNKLVRGVDYPGNGPEPQLRIETLSKPPPDSTFLMNLIMVHMVNRNMFCICLRRTVELVRQVLTLNLITVAWVTIWMRLWIMLMCIINKLERWSKWMIWWMYLMKFIGWLEPEKFSANTLLNVLLFGW